MDPPKIAMRSFVTESSIEEARKNRETQGVPEQPYDPRTLYERLAEQRQIKEEQFAEAWKLGNMIHRIDDDESEFLKELLKNEKRKKDEIETEEREALKIFKKEVAKKSYSDTQPLVEKKESLTQPENSTSSNSRIDKEIASRKKQYKKTDITSLVQTKKANNSSTTASTPIKAETKKEVKVSIQPPIKKQATALNLVDYDSGSESE